MKAARIFYDKALLPDGAVVEMTIWQLPRATVERPHGLKYSLFYGHVGQRVVGYDNERGKGDHKHLGTRELRYKFESVEKLITDFLDDVERMKNEPQP
jgi:hypothetical protein